MSTWRASKRLENAGPETGPHHPAVRDTVPPRKEDRLLALQRSVGNQAVQELLQSSEGEKIPESDREKFESAFGEDLSEVRIHHGQEAAELSAEAGANAFTAGRDIYFAEGMYAPQTPEGERLLAHELTHVLQQELPGAEKTDRPGQPEDPAEIEARQVAGAVLRHDVVPEIASATRGVHRDDGGPAKAPPDPYGTLLRAFAQSFPDAAKLILSSPAGMKLVKEAETAGVKFAGFAEDGPGKHAWPYTVGDSVYVPKARDKVQAASDFLFELNNAVRRPQFAALQTEATKGTKGSLTAKEYAKKNVELEVEGMLRTGEIWFEMKKQAPKGAKWDRYDKDFFLAQYKAFHDGKKTKEQIVQEVLQWASGFDKSKTNEQFYMDQYQDLSGGK